MSKRDYYEVLEVNKNATPDELKQAFRQLARKYHPDVSQEPDAEEKFKEINEAYAVLSDDQKRAAYDRYGHAGVSGMGGAPDFTNIDLSDILEEIFQGFGGFGFGNRGRRSRNAPRRGQDLQYALNLSFEEAAFGAEKEVSITRNEICDRCKGEGAEPDTTKEKCQTCDGRGEVRVTRQSLFGNMVQVTTCPTCNGRGETIATPCRSCQSSGYQRKTRAKKVSVPAGVDSGNQIRLSAEGEPGANGGPNGDVYLVIKVMPHKFFRRRNNDVLLDLNINVAQATLGAEVEVPTIDGLEKLTIPAGTQPGKIITMRNKGIPILRSDRRGNQLVLVNIDIPTKLNSEQKELFEKLAESLGTEVMPQEKGFFDRLRDAFG